MQALIPHKDILFSLSAVQRDFIKDWNTFNLDALLYPDYPLWAFEDSFPLSFTSACFTSILMKDNSVYFVLEISDSNETEEHYIKLGHFAEENKKKTARYKSAAFPLSMKSYRTGTVTFERNRYRLYDEKWFKCKG